MSRNRIKAFDAPFVGITTTVLDSPAWKAMSPAARIVYMAIKRNYNHKTNNNGRLYLASRDGPELTGLSAKTTLKCTREIIHYGFAVITRGASLGLDGHGRPTYLRLTEMGTRADPTPTRDFLKWDGVLFGSGRGHAARNLPLRPKDDQSGNGIPGRAIKSKTPHTLVTHPARPCAAPVHTLVMHPKPEVHTLAVHRGAEGAHPCGANLVSPLGGAGGALGKGRKGGSSSF